MALLQICKITIPAAGQEPAKTYYFRTSKGKYTGEISTKSGIEAAADNFENDEPLIPVHQLIISGKLMRLEAECKKENTKKMVEVLVRRDKVEEALTQPKGSLEDLPLGNFGTIRTVRSSGKDSYR